MGWECSVYADDVCEQNSLVTYAVFSLSIYAAKTYERISFGYFKKMHVNVLVVG